MSDDIRIRLARTRSDFEACIPLQRAVWGIPDLEITSAIHLIATVHAGGFVHLAETADGKMVGFAYAFPALRGGIPHLHSDMLAVLPELRARGLGARLKWAQRDEALARGVGLISWTYDPMQARNANLNLRRLGAQAPQFVADFYGRTSSALHHGLPTDRLLVRWELKSKRVQDCAASGEPTLVAAAPTHPRINDVKWQAGWPVSSEPRQDLTDGELLLEIPPDWDVLCQAAPVVAQDWHGKVRRALQAYLGRGYVAADFVPSEERGRRRPLYLLRKA
jgi:predicted GNAT superfamily acetyltransferase